MESIYKCKTIICIFHISYVLGLTCIISNSRFIAILEGLSCTHLTVENLWLHSDRSCPHGSLLMVGQLYSGLLKQHTGLLIFKRVGRGSDAGEQRVTAPVVLTVPDQICCCQRDLLGLRWTGWHFTGFQT